MQIAPSGTEAKVIIPHLADFAEHLKECGRSLQQTQQGRDAMLTLIYKGVSALHSLPPALNEILGWVHGTAAAAQEAGVTMLAMASARPMLAHLPCPTRHICLADGSCFASVASTAAACQSGLATFPQVSDCDELAPASRQCPQSHCLPCNGGLGWHFG